MKPDEQALLAEVAAGETARDAGPRLGIHWRRVRYLCEKWTRKRWYDYGVSADLGWLEDAGFEQAVRLGPGRFVYPRRSCISFPGCPCGAGPFVLTSGSPHPCPCGRVYAMRGPVDAAGMPRAFHAAAGLPE